MEASDLSDILNVRAVKMENCDNAFEDPSGSVEISDPLSLMPQYVTESDLGLMQSTSELLHAPLAVFSDAVDEEDTTQSSDSADGPDNDKPSGEEPHSVPGITNVPETETPSDVPDIKSVQLKEEETIEAIENYVNFITTIHTVE